MEVGTLSSHSARDNVGGPKAKWPKSTPAFLSAGRARELPAGGIPVDVVKTGQCCKRQ